MKKQDSNVPGEILPDIVLSIRYVLPSGTVRYHCDSFCSTSKDINHAKPAIYKNMTLPKALQLGNDRWRKAVRENLEYVFECGLSEKVFKEVWESTPLPDIKIELFHREGLSGDDFKRIITRV